MPRISYQYDPNDPEGEDRARILAYLRVIFGWGTIIAFLAYLASIQSLLEEGFSLSALSGIGIFGLVCVVDFFILTGECDKREKAEIAKRIIPDVLLGIIGVGAAFGIICKGSSVILKGIEAVLIVIIIFVLVLRRKKRNGEQIKMKTTSNGQSITSYIYCPKCGTELKWDCKQCTSCGMKLKK